MMIWYKDSRTSVCPSATVPTGWARPLVGGSGSAEEVEVGVVAGVESESEWDVIEVVQVAEAKLRVL